MYFYGRKFTPLLDFYAISGLFTKITCFFCFPDVRWTSRRNTTNGNYSLSTLSIYPPGRKGRSDRGRKVIIFFCAPPQKSACQIGCFIYDAVSCAPAPKRVLRNVQLCPMPLRHRHKRVPRSDHRRERSRSSAGSAPCSSDGPVSSDISAGSDQFRPLMWSSDEFRRDPISPARIPPTTSQ